MGFDAGSITGHLKLDRTEFDADLEEVKTEAQDLEDNPIVVDAKIDKTEFDASAEEIRAEKDSLGSAVTSDASLNTDEFDAGAVEVEAAKKIMSEPVDVPITADTSSFDASLAKAEADSILFRQAMNEALSAVTGGNKDLANAPGLPTGSTSIVKMMLGQGASAADTASFLKSTYETPINDARLAVAAFARDQLMVSDATLRAASVQAIGVTQYTFKALDSIANTVSGYALPWGAVPSTARTLFGSQAMIGSGSGGGALSLTGPAAWLSQFAQTARDPFGSQLALPAGPDPWGIAGGAGVAQGWGEYLSGAASTPIKDVIDAVAADASGASSGGGFLSNIFSSLKGKGSSLIGSIPSWSSISSSLFGGMGNIGTLAGGKSGISSTLMGDPAKAMDAIVSAIGTSFAAGDTGAVANLIDMAASTGGRLTKDMADSLAKGMLDEVKSSTGFVGRAVGGLGAIGGGLSNWVSGLSPIAQAGIYGGPLAVPIMGAVGAAAGGALAGTAIAGAGFGAYGLLAMGALKDLSTAYTAHAQLTSGQITQAQYNQQVSGLTPAAVAAINGGLGKQFSAFNTGTIHPLQNQIVGQVTGLMGGVGAALPAVTPFLQTSVNSMGGFLGRTSSDLKSKGFSGFMGTMTKDLKPLMGDFGSVIDNLTSAFGGFLKLFGGQPAQMVGKWFVTVSHDLANFANHVKLGSGFLSGMVTAFKFLGSVGALVVSVLDKLGKGLAPIGLNIMKILTPALNVGAALVKMIPDNVITAIVGIALGLIAFHKAFGMVTSIISLGKKVFMEFGIVMDFLAANPIVLLIAAIVLLGVGIYLLVTHWKQAWTDIKNWFDDAVKFLRSGFGTLILMIMGPVGAILFLALHWQAVWSTIKQVGLDAWNFLDGDVFQPITNFFTQTIPNAFNTGVGFFQQFPGRLLTALGDGLTLLYGWGKDIVTGIANGIKDAASKIWHALTNALDSIPGFNGMKNFVSHIPGFGWVGHLATGGAWDGSSPVIVGERGPELLMPNANGFGGVVTPNNRLSAMGGTVITIAIDARGASPGTAQAISTAVNSTLPKLRNALQRGAA